MYHPFHGNGTAADVRMTSDAKQLELLLKNVIFQCKTIFISFVSSQSMDFSWLLAAAGVHQLPVFPGRCIGVHGMLPVGLLLLGEWLCEP